MDVKFATEVGCIGPGAILGEPEATRGVWGFSKGNNRWNDGKCHIFIF